MGSYIHWRNNFTAVKNMIKHKKAMLARDWMIMLIVFGVITGLGFLVVSDIAGSDAGYNVTGMVDEDFQDNYDTLSDASSDIYKMQNATSSGEGMSVISTYTAVFKATFSIVSIIFGSLGSVSGILANFAEDFGVPTAIANIIFPGILVMIITILVFVVISAVNQGRM